LELRANAPTIEGIEADRKGSVMTGQEIAAVVHPAEAVLRRRPVVCLSRGHAGRYWSGERHAVRADMPRELGGNGDEVSVSWLTRDGFFFPSLA
jgi:hypothetical protein